MIASNSAPRQRRTLALVGLVVVAVLASACGSDSDSAATTASVAESGASSADSTATSTETSGAASDTTPVDTANVETTTATDAPTTTAEDLLGTLNPATGDPILIGTVNDGGSDALQAHADKTLEGITIAAKYANEYLGGIAGHPIEIVACEAKATPAGVADCANQFVEKQVSAVVYPPFGEEGAVVPIITAAGIPMLIATAADKSSYTTPGVFSSTGGLPAILGGFAIRAKANGVKKFGFLVIDVPAATSGVAALGGIAFKSQGVELQVVPVAPGTPDMTPQVQSAISGGADALAVMGDAGLCASFLQAYKTLALTTPKYMINTCVDPAVVSAVPDVLAGSFVTTSKAPGPDDAIYAATAEKYGDDVDPNPNVSAAIADGWVSMMNFVNTMKGYTGPIDPASITAQIKAAKDVPIALSGGLTSTCDGTAIPIVPNLCSGGIQVATVDSEGNFSDYVQVDTSEAFANPGG